MAADFGHSFNRLGSDITTSTDLVGGRVCLGSIIQEDPGYGGVVTNFQFPAAASAADLRVVQVGGALHTWEITTMNGVPTVRLTSIYRTGYTGGLRTCLVVFAVNTSETIFDGMGIQLTNTLGERVVSGVAPVPVFVGSQSFVGVNPSQSNLALGGGWVMDRWNLPTTIGAGCNRLIMWRLNDETGTNAWVSGTSFLDAYDESAGKFIELIIVRPAGYGYSPPTANFFILNGIEQSSDVFGLRLWNQYGHLTFDAGLNHLRLLGYPNNISFPTNATDVYSYDVPMINGNTLTLIPDFSYTIFSGSTVNTFQRFVKRTGSALQTRVFQIFSASSTIAPQTLIFGNSNNLSLFCADASLYGG